MLTKLMKNIQFDDICNILIDKCIQGFFFKTLFAMKKIWPEKSKIHTKVGVNLLGMTSHTMIVSEV